MNRNSMICKDYRVNRNPNELVTVEARFILRVNPKDNLLVAEAMKNLELLLGSANGINFVKGTDKPRCMWCGVLNDSDKNTCTQCGGSL